MRYRFFKFLAMLSSRKPWLIITIAAVLTATSAYYTATNLTLNADLDDLVSEELDYHKKYKDFLTYLKELEEKITTEMEDDDFISVKIG